MRLSRSLLLAALATQVLLPCVADCAPVRKPTRPPARPSPTASNAAFIAALRKAAERGKPVAQTLLGVGYYDGLDGIPRNYPVAVKWFRKAAAQGDANAQTMLGVCYNLGRGVKQNNAEAVKWWCRAAAQGDADALKLLGYNANNFGLDHDPPEEPSYADDLRRIEREKEQRESEVPLATWGD